jgi:predicted ATPase/DNA-binding CsgD family transcriptional regulator
MMLDQTAQRVEAPQPGNQGSLLEQRGRATPNNLPLALSSFVGRTEAMAKVRRLLASTRLLTLTGSGGVGKTRLALEVSTGLLDDFAEGVWWVDLAPLCEDDLVAYTIAMTLGLPDDPARSTVATLSRHLRDRDLLLVLDNCEHLIGECAELAGQLLRYAPRLRMMATSREALGIDGETVWSVPPLSLPCLEEIPTRESLLQSEAGQLFLERAWAIQPDLLLSEAVARAIAQICCRLEGIPLAIELAAARVRALSVSQIAAHLDDLFRLLTEGSRTALPRHRTLQATIEWSYDLLSGPEQRLFERLAVFVAGFSLEAAEAVASDPAGPGAALAGGVLDLLSRLVLKSLVAMREGEPVRYGMLDSVRQYAWKRLLASGELERIRERHLTHYLEVAERAESELTGAEQVTWLRLLESEHDNLRAALLWSQESGAGQAGLRLATALAAFWLRVGYLSEGSGWIERALAACEEAGPLRAKALYQAGRLAQAGGDYEQALALTSQSLALSRQLENKQGMARALGLMGRITHAQGDRDRARPLLEEGLTLARESGDERTIARTLLFLGDLCLRQGAHEQAATLLHEALGLYQGMGDSWSVAWALGALGDLARLQGDHQRAVGLLQLSLALYQELDSKSEMPYTLEALAITAADQGQFRRAAHLWGAASGLRDAVHAHLQPSYVSEYAPTLEKVRAALGKDAFAIAWAEGQAMTLAEALALATEDTPAAEPAEPGPPSPKPEPPSSAQPRAQAYGLTPREVEVLRLVACGLTDAQIAEKLVISPRTVGKHLESIYSKLYLSSRSAATRWAIEHGLA